MNSDYAILHLSESHKDTMFVIDNNGDTSVTNNAANVVKDVLSQHYCKPDSRIIYRDSMGRWDEMKHDGKAFVGFAPLGPEDKEKYAKGIRRIEEYFGLVPGCERPALNTPAGHTHTDEPHF